MPIYVGDTTGGRTATTLAATGSTWFGNSSDDAHNMQGTLYLTGAAVFNMVAASTGDFTVKSTTSTHMFFVDSSADMIGIGTSSPNCMLHVAGAFAAAGPSETFQTFANGDYTPSVANGNLFKTYDGAGQGATSLDDGVAGQIVTIISTDAFTYMVSGGNLKGGTTNIATAAGDVTTWIYDGTYWYLMIFMDQSADLSGGH